MKLEEKKLNSKNVYSGKILNLEVDEVELPDGGKSVRECVRHSDGAAVLLEKDGKILLVKQFRYLYNKSIYEIPAGKLNDGEDPCLGAERELEEETGYKANLRKEFDMYPSPGYTDEVIHVFRAIDYKYIGQKLDDGEFLDIDFLSVEDIKTKIEGGEICDGKTIAAFFKFIAEKDN